MQADELTVNSAFLFLSALGESHKCQVPGACALLIELAVQQGSLLRDAQMCVFVTAGDKGQGQRCCPAWL